MKHLKNGAEKKDVSMSSTRIQQIDRLNPLKPSRMKARSILCPEAINGASAGSAKQSFTSGRFS